MIPRAAVAILAAASALTCGGRRALPPRGQVVLYVDTDAPLVAAPDQATDPAVPVGLFDSLRVEIVDGAGSAACDACRRDFPVDARALAEERTSVGIVLPPNRSDLRARVQLFRAVRLRGDAAPSDGSVDRLFMLPPIGEEGIVEYTAFAPLDSVGKGPSGEAPEALLPGRSYRHALRDGVTPAACAGAPLAGEACVLGGAFWMSNAQRGDVVSDGTTPPERVVLLSPFYVDTHEVTVGELRTSQLATAVDPVVGSGAAGECTFTAAPGPNEEMPVDCVSWELAKRFCENRAKLLPTEAQLEYLGSGMRSNLHVWGNDPPGCVDAVFARWIGPATDRATEITKCVAFGAGPERAGGGQRDVVRLPSGDVFDVAGNVSEWAADTFQLLTEDCWGAGLRVDPLCDRPSQAAPDRHTFRGGSWKTSEVDLRAVSGRAGASGIVAGLRSGEFADVGFRCSRPGTR